MINEDKSEKEARRTISEVGNFAPRYVKTIQDTINEAIEENNASEYNPKMSEDYSLFFYSGIQNPEYLIRKTGGRELTAVVQWDSHYCSPAKTAYL